MPSLYSWRERLNYWEANNRVRHIHAADFCPCAHREKASERLLFDFFYPFLEREREARRELRNFAQGASTF